MASPGVPDVSAEDPEGGGVEQQPRDEDQEVEVAVGHLDAALPAAHVEAARRGGGGGVGHRPRPLFIPSHLD